MTEQVRSRRSLLRNGAVGAGMIGASAVAVGLVPEAALAATVGPWNYVAPGESIQAAVTGGSRAIQLGDGAYAITGPIIATSGLTIRGIGQRTRIVATAADRQPNGEVRTMRHGFNRPAAISTAGMLVAPSGWNTLGTTVNLR